MYNPEVEPVQSPNRIVQYLEGAAAGALGGAIGLVVLHKFGISLEVPVEASLVIGSAATGGIAKASSNS